MRIKLILAASPNDALRWRDPFMPLSLPLLAAAAPGHDYELVDMLWDSHDIDFGAPVDLVGISVRLTAEATAYEVADAFRARGVKIVLGGPQVSAVPWRAKEHADAVVVGEAEALWPVIAADAAAGRLKEIYVCADREMDTRGRPAYQIPLPGDLRGLPRARRDLFKRRYVFDTVFAARGCPIDCDFCAVPSLYGREVRLRPVAEVVAEIADFRGFYYLLDDTIFGRGATQDYYLELYDAIAALPGRRLFTGQVNLDALASDKGREVARRAARAGLVYAAAGMESLNPPVMEASGAIRKLGVERPADAAAVLAERIAFLQELGVIVSGWFVMGYEEDSLDTYRKTLAFCLENRVLPVFSPVNALPGTRLHARLEEQGKLDPRGTMTNVPHPTMTNAEVLAALDRVVREGYGIKESWRRTAFHVGRSCRRPDRSARDVVERTIFALVLQKNMRKILLAENANLASPLSQNYVPE